MAHPTGPARRAMRAASLLAGALAVSGCVGMAPPSLPQTQREIEDVTPLVHVPSRQAWVNPEGLKIVMQRGLGNGAEQRLALRNETVLEGDNVMVIRTRLPSFLSGSLRFEEFLARAGGLPAPFEDMTSGDLSAGEDALGPYFWADRRFGANTSCVLAIRRLDTGARQMPDGARAMDIMLRNCVNGEPQDALGPILAASVGGGPGGAPAGGESRMLSPLAGPTPR
ncbi:MAG: hypothetical protein KF887_16645 [Paracoccaceae bacterium]|nr:MAG: hypothetical protein KF887_16645 [Paracoccaceae bacterium]